MIQTQDRHATLDSIKIRIGGITFEIYVSLTSDISQTTKGRPKN